MGEDREPLWSVSVSVSVPQTKAPCFNVQKESEMLTRDKVRGLVVGGPIGDGLGMAVETWSPEKIVEVHPPNGITKYEAPKGHKWFTTDPNDPDPKKTYMEPGMTTDDTQLTVATLRGLNIAKTFCLDEQARQHVVALRANTAGWGKTTVESIKRLANNVSWADSGKTTETQRGTGNGLPMKCSPLAAYRLTLEGSRDEAFWQKVISYCAMSHYTRLSAQAAVIHTHAVLFNLMTDPHDFDIDNWLDYVCNQSFNVFEDGSAKMDHLNNGTKDNLEHEMIFLYENRAEIKTWTVDQIRERFGNGSCYVFHSLPFTYALYIQNPHAFDTILRIVNAGGDTDTNAKMACELLGGLHGLTFFESLPSWVLDDLQERIQYIGLADEFCDTFGVA